MAWTHFFVFEENFTHPAIKGVTDIFIQTGNMDIAKAIFCLHFGFIPSGYDGDCVGERCYTNTWDSLQRASVNARNVDIYAPGFPNIETPLNKACRVLPVLHLSFLNNVRIIRKADFFNDLIPLD
jgi:hypothetical protein